jgi:hypothetical protein
MNWQLFTRLLSFLLIINVFIVISGFCAELWPNQNILAVAGNFQTGIAKGGCSMANQGRQQDKQKASMPCCLTDQGQSNFYATIQTPNFSKTSLALAYIVASDFFPNLQTTTFSHNNPFAPPEGSLIKSTVLRI